MARAGCVCRFIIDRNFCFCEREEYAGAVQGKATVAKVNVMRLSFDGDFRCTNVRTHAPVGYKGMEKRGLCVFVLMEIMPVNPAGCRCATTTLNSMYLLIY